jgi:hypothetical protein
MTNKLGEVVNYGCYGGKAISIHHTPNSGDISIQLPDCMNDVPVGVLAYIDKEGKIAFMEEDPHDYEDRDES